MIREVTAAEALSRGAHAGQTRKYTGAPYWTHCYSVAKILHADNYAFDVVSAAWLHDTLEDTQLPPEEIEAVCGREVLQLVIEVTDVSKAADGNRAERKRIDREHLAKASAHAQSLKLADLIDNALSIVEHDPKFATVYMVEKRELLTVLTKGSLRLWERADALVKAWEVRRP